MRMCQKLLLCASITFLAGCNLRLGQLKNLLDDLEITINNNINEVQTRDPRTIVVPPIPDGTSNTIIINATVITDVSSQLVIEELPDITLLAFENLTGTDIFVRYLADGVIQSVFVLDGETVLLEYPCLTTIELLSEDDFDPFTGDFLDAFDLTGISYENPFDFECGDAFIISIDPDGVLGVPTTIDLE